MTTLVSDLNGKNKFILNGNLKGSDNEGFDKAGKYDKGAFDITFKHATTKSDTSLSEKKFKKEPQGPHITYLSLFRFATAWEKSATILGIVLASISSIGLPISVILYGEFTTLLVDRAVRTGTSTETLVLSWFGGGAILTNATIAESAAALIKDSQAFGIGSLCVSMAQFLVGAASIDIINYSALRIIGRIRRLFLKSVLRQDISWYDTITDNNFAVRITDDLDKVKEGIGEKLSIFIYLVMSFIISVILSFFYGWKLTLVILSCAPIIIGATAFVAKMQSTLTEKELHSYSSAGCVAEEVLSGIRTVIAFGGEEKESERFKDRLRSAEENGMKKGLFSGIGGGIMWFIIYCCYALAFWYGVGLILESRNTVEKEYTPAVLIIVLFGVLAGAQNLGMTSPYLEAFATARGSAAAIYSIIDRKPLIDSMGEIGLRPKDINGDILFSAVHFRYPARSDVNVLNGLTLNIKSGQTVAFVGPSGCGKSTCLQLMQRLYDPLMGSIKVDGVNINELNTSWLRSHIGVVGQEPVLFSTSIGENIRYGKPDVSDALIEKAAKIANCHDFISKMPNGYDTKVGERGSQLSGGQKQRIAIARAIVRNPRILLLDEATSALDPYSEKKVQNALEKASKGRTTLVVSHRLNTITNADQIVYIDNGLVIESGTHNELINKKGRYFDLVHASNTKPTNIDGPAKPKRRISSRKSVSIKDDSSINNESTIPDDVEVEHQEEVYKVKWLRLLKMNTPEWPYILVGCISAIIVGGALPVFAILFGEVYGILAMGDVEEVSHRSNLYSFFFVLLGVATGLGTFFQTYMFNISGVRLTSRLRQLVFKAMMNQEMGWYDESKNSIGALCVRLSGDCASVQGATGTRLGSILQALSTIAIGVAISFYFSWDLTLVSLIAVPIVLGAVFFESRYMETSSIAEKVAMETATKIAIEAISNIRTVASLCQEEHVLKRYIEECKKVEIACRKKVRLRGVVFSLGQAVPIFGYGISLYYGGVLVANQELEYKTVIKVSEALIFGSWMLGQALAYAPNVNAAIVSAGRLMRILDRIPKVHDPPIANVDLDKKSDGNIKYDEVEFCYPTRPDIQILQGLYLDIQQGLTVALVGPSGCGKSTCIQLLLRYYDANYGHVLLGDTNTTDMPIHHLRSHMGIVSQEPVLFDRTIAENIAYGDNSRKIEMPEIIEAAKMANIHNFVSTLPVGYDTPLGAKGAQLSGGQKQRIAIARALVRNPKILLLDEATSALDTQSESVVQEALDVARAGRTCITIAHRLTTIHNADVICVIDDGLIKEKGTHEELLAMGKLYAKLYEMQQV